MRRLLFVPALALICGSLLAGDASACCHKKQACAPVAVCAPAPAPAPVVECAPAPKKCCFKFKMPKFGCHKNACAPVATCPAPVYAPTYAPAPVYAAPQATPQA